VGTPLLCPILTRFGRIDVAERLLRQDTYPSWLYPVKLGATTMWERWNSYTLEDGFGDAAMNSFNHYAYGAIGEWLYSTLGGISPLESNPGYSVVRCAPIPCAGVSWARTWHETPRGRLAVNWKVSKHRRFSIDIVVPPDTVADVVLPGASIEGLRPNGARPADSLGGLRQKEGGVALRIGSGRHVFSYNLGERRLGSPL
jgi:alpha-L-rhamnosidase